MKRYWVFICESFYPKGGMKDFKNSYDDIENAMKFCYEGSNNLDCGCGYGHIFDSKEFKVIKSFWRDDLRNDLPLEERFRFCDEDEDWLSCQFQ